MNHFYCSSRIHWLRNESAHPKGKSEKQLRLFLNGASEPKMKGLDYFELLEDAIVHLAILLDDEYRL